MIEWVYQLELAMLVYSSLAFIFPLPPFQTSSLRHPGAFVYRSIVMIMVFGNCVFIASGIALVALHVSNRDTKENEAELYQVAGYAGLVAIFIYAASLFVSHACKACGAAICYTCTRRGALCGATCRKVVGNPHSNPSGIEDKLFAPFVSLLVSGIAMAILPRMSFGWSAGTFFIFLAVSYIVLNCLSEGLTAFFVSIQASFFICTSILFSAACIFDSDDLFALQTQSFYGIALAVIVVATTMHLLYNYGLRKLTDTFNYDDDDLEPIYLAASDQLDGEEPILKIHRKKKNNKNNAQAFRKDERMESEDVRRDLLPLQTSSLTRPSMAVEDGSGKCSIPMGSRL